MSAPPPVTVKPVAVVVADPALPGEPMSASAHVPAVVAGAYPSNTSSATLQAEFAGPTYRTYRNAVATETVTAVYRFAAGVDGTAYSVTSPAEKSDVFDPWNSPPLMRDSYPTRGKNWTCVMTCGVPRSRPTYGLVAVAGASKNVAELRSNAREMVSPSLSYDPLVPTTKPPRWDDPVGAASSAGEVTLHSRRPSSRSNAARSLDPVRRTTSFAMWAMYPIRTVDPSNLSSRTG